MKKNLLNVVKKVITRKAQIKSLEAEVKELLKDLSLEEYKEVAEVLKEDGVVKVNGSRAYKVGLAIKPDTMQINASEVLKSLGYDAKKDRKKLLEEHPEWFTTRKGGPSWKVDAI